MKRVKENQVGAYVAAIGITVATVAHYAEFWISSYVIAILAGLIASMIFMGE